MFSAWRKLTKKQDEKPVFPLGVAPVDQTMQKKYAKGVQYNMKLIIKGDRNTGKSVLLQRLSGHKFKEEYIPTQEIQVSNVNWSYQGNGDVVKTEVWDIVDKSKKKRTPSGSLKINNDTDDATEESNPMDALALDAEFIDVYKGTHGVFLTMDITKAWTWQYVQRELEKIPLHIPILILASFRDMGGHRVVQAEEMLAYIQHLDRPAGSAEVYFTECSMKDGFGLQFIHSFLNMPFLMLQRETLMRQLEANTLEIEDTRETLSFDESSEQHNYDLFTEMLLRKANPQMSDSPTLPSKTEEMATTASSPAPTPPSPPTTAVSTLQVEPSPTPQPKQPPPVATVSPIVQSPPSPQAPQQPQQQPSKFQAYKAKLFGNKNPPAKEKEPTLDISDLDVVPIEDFNPGQLDNDFLDTGAVNNKSVARKAKKLDSDDDSDGGNPMVAGYEDFDSDSDENVAGDDVFPSSNGAAVNDGNFAGTDSEDDDFEDFSSDEDSKPAPETSQGTSLMEQIKSSKKLEKQKKEQESKKKSSVDEIVVNTQELDLDRPEYAALDSDAEVNDQQDSVDGGVSEDLVKGTISISENVVLQSTTHPSPEENHAPLVIAKTEIEPSLDTPGGEVDNTDDDEDDDDDDDEANAYVIAGDVDVDDDWMNDKGDSDDSYGGNDDKGMQNGDSVVDVEEESKLDNSTSVATSEITPDVPQDSSMNFDLDDLEAFMSDQMSKSIPVPAVNETSVVEQDAEKPKKKKKKKKTTAANGTETSEPAAEKKKKKKTKSKETGDDDDVTNTPKSKTKKSKKTTESEGGRVVSSAKKTKKNIKKKSTSENTLDDFFAS